MRDPNSPNSDAQTRDWRAEIAERLVSLRLAPAEEADLADELSQHLEDRFRELRVRGMGDTEARRLVLEELDGEGSLASRLRDVVRGGSVPAALGAPTRGTVLGRLRQDARYAMRTMRRAPGFTAVVVLTLALGIGAATTIFSVVNGVLLTPLPYKDPQQLVVFYGTSPEKQLPEVSFPSGLFVAVREKSRAFTNMAAFDRPGFTLTGKGDPVRVDAAMVSEDFFRVFRTGPLVGRTFVAGEHRPENTTVSVISFGLWQRMFGGDPKIVGRVIKLNGNPSTIVGVMPREFAMPERTDVWLPLSLDPALFNCWCLDMVGRMKPGISTDQAKRDLIATVDAFTLSRHDVFPDAKPEDHAKIVVVPLVNRIAGDLRTPLLVLITAVGVVLLIACANIANLLLARASVRNREMAVRCCLGASPRRIATQLLTESAMLAGAGAALGLVLAAVALRLLRRLPEGQIPRIDHVRVDPIVVLFAVGVTVACVLLFGLVPAFRAARVDLQTNLKDGARGSASGGARRVSNAFVVIQFALSLVLLAGSGLLLKSFQRLISVDPGFRAENVLVARLQTPYPRYENSQVVRGFYDRVLERVAAIPGVRAVGLTQSAPFTRGNPQSNVIAEGKEPKPGEPVVVSNVRTITPGFFDAMGTPILKGRSFRASDGPDAPRVAIVDERFARHYWPNGEAVGKHISPQGDTSAGHWRTIIGVVPNVRHASLGEDPSLQVYESFAQQTAWSVYLIVRSARDPRALVSAIRAQVAAVDPEIPLYGIRTMEEAVSRSLLTRRLTNGLLAAFATAAFLLAAIGIYGVISIGVAGRMREFGVRIALGAKPGNVLQLVLQEGVWLAGAGIALGLLGAVSVVRFLRSLLFGVSAFDVPTFVAATTVLALVAIVACLIPARRATRVAPAVVLRE
ncbi:MAG TPA: ABC transporter permease [Gemmatimonadaceae bacterium]|nr:ABC transporter permease [Gemmatimonadaceae bacterium]